MYLLQQSTAAVRFQLSRRNWACCIAVGGMKRDYRQGVSNLPMLQLPYIRDGLRNIDFIVYKLVKVLSEI
jgi:hypothetical protein